MQQLSKPCKYCGREFEWRKKWENRWDEVKFCSSGCSKQNMKHGEHLEKSILELLKTRGPSKSICPSEILDPDLKSNKMSMEEVRCAARRLVNKNMIKITQNNKIVDPSLFKGPIRLKLK